MTNRVTAEDKSFPDLFIKIKNSSVTTFVMTYKKLLDQQGINKALPPHP